MPTQERDELAKVLLLIAKNSKKRGLLAGVAASVARLFAQDLRETNRILADFGPEGLLSYLPSLARSKWRERWREGMSDILSDLVSAFDRESGKRQALGVSFNLQNPYLEEYLDQKASKLSLQIPTTTRHAVEREVRDGLLRGESTLDMAKRINGVFESAKESRAQTIARTEANGAQNAASYLQATASGVVRTKTWLATKDSRTREEHRHLDGTTIPLGDEFPDEGLWPAKPNCRCTLTYGVDEEALTSSDEEPEADKPERRLLAGETRPGATQSLAVTGQADDFLRRELPDHSPQWSGKLAVVDDAALPTAVGVKGWDCTITIRESTAGSLVRRHHTALHEMLHAFSPGHATDDKRIYGDMRGYEEGPVEKMTRVLLPRFVEENDLPFNEEQERQYERSHSYNRYIRAIEIMRGFIAGPEMTGQSDEEFYRELFAQPLKDRPQWLYNKGADAVEKYEAAGFPGTMGQWEKLFMELDDILRGRTSG